MFETLLSAGGLIGKVIDKIFPDKESADKAKLKFLELQQAGEFKQLEMDLEKQKLKVADIASARQRQSDMAEAGIPDGTPTILALLVSIGFFGIMTLLAFVDIDKDVARVLEIMMGVLGTAFVQIISYYFGACKKDNVITFTPQKENRHIEIK